MTKHFLTLTFFGKRLFSISSYITNYRENCRMAGDERQPQWHAEAGPWDRGEEKMLLQCFYAHPDGIVWGSGGVPREVNVSYYPLKPHDCVSSCSGGPYLLTRHVPRCLPRV